MVSVVKLNACYTECKINGLEKPTYHCNCEAQAYMH